MCQQLNSWFAETCVYRRIYTPLKACITQRSWYQKWSQVSMRGKQELFILIVSLAFFLVDLGTDISLAVKYNRQDEALWFTLTLLFVVGPHVVITVMATYFAKGDVRVKLRVFVETLFSSLLMRYVEQFKHWKQKYCNNSPCEGCQGNYKECSCTDCEQYRKVVKEYNESAYAMAWYRYVETIAESAPQWCLQVSIMLNQWDFPGLTVTSSVFSFLALALSITGLEKARVTKEGRDFNPFYAAIFFLFNMCILLSRLSAIVFHIFAYPSGEWVYFFLSHWVLMNWIQLKDTGCHWCILALFSFIPYINIFMIPFFIHPTKAYYLWVEMGRDATYCCFYILISAENLIITLIPALQPPTGLEHLSVLKPVVLSFVIVGLFLSCFLASFYYDNCCCQEDDAEDV